MRTLVKIADTLDIAVEHFFLVAESKPILSAPDEIKFLKEKAALLQQLIENQKGMITFLEKAGKERYMLILLFTFLHYFSSPQRLL